MRRRFAAVIGKHDFMHHRDLALCGKPLGLAAEDRQGHLSEHGLDGDVLIAAQALAEDAAVVTTNTRHVLPLVRAVEWTALSSDE